MAEEEVILLKIDLDAQSMIKQVAALSTQINNLKESNKQLAVEAKKALQAGDNAKYEIVTQSIVKNNLAIKALGDQQKNQTNLLNLQQKANTAAAGSYEQLLRQQQIASIQLKNLEGTLKKNADGTIVLTEAYTKQKQAVDTAKGAIIAFDQGIKDGRTNVGNYTASFTEAINKSGVFSGQLGILRDTLNGTKQGFEAVKAGLGSLSQGIDSFKEFAKGAFTAKDAVSGVGEAGKVAGAGIEGGAAAGANGMKLLKIAIASTGIGLLVIAIGAVITAFAKTEEGGNKLKQIFSGIGAVTDVLIGGLGKLGTFLIDVFTKPQEILTEIYNFLDGTFIKALKGYYNILLGIVTLDFTQVKAGFNGIKDGAQNFGSAIGKAGDAVAKYAAEQKKAYDLGVLIEKQQQTYDKQQVIINAKLAENLKLSGDLRTESENKLNTDQQRLDALQKAGELEKENLVIEKNNAAERFKIAAENKRLADLAGKGSLEANTKLIEAQTDYLNKVDAVEDKVNDIKSEGSKIRLSMLRAEIASTIGLLDNDLKQRQLQGDQAFELQRTIAAKARTAALQDSTLSAKEKLKIESDYQLKLAEIAKSEQTFRSEISNNITDLSIAAINDKTTREIAAEATAAQRKIESLKGTEQEIQTQRELILQASQLKIDEITAAQDAKELADLQASENTKTDALKASSDAQIKIQQDQAAQEQLLTQLRLDLAGTVVSGFKNLLGQDEKNRKKYGDAIKVLSLAEIAINLQKELSAIAAAAAANALNAVTAGGAGVAQYAIQSAIAIIRAGIAAKTVSAQKFAAGGYTFRDGGHVQSARVGLIGEAGPEWVAPNWMMKHPKTAPILNSLEHIRMNGGYVPFANGGFTQSNYYNSVLSSFTVEDAMRMMQSQPPPVVIVQDINEVQGRTAQVVDRANI